MQRNSKQQSFSVTIRGKREQLRSQIRKQQLQDFLKSKRLEYFDQGRKHDEKYETYRALNDRVNKQKDQSAINDVQVEILQTLGTFPSQMLNFFIIGNFLLWHPQKLSNFQNHILNESNVQLHSNKDFLWCLAVYAHAVWKVQQVSSDKKESLAFLQRIDVFLAVILQKYWESLSICQNSISCMDIFILSFMQLLSALQDQKFFPINSFKALLSHLDEFYKRISTQNLYVNSLKMRITSLTNQIIIKIKKKELFSHVATEFQNQEDTQFVISPTTLEKFIKFSSQIFYENIRDVSDERSRCIQSIKILCQFCPIYSGQYIFCKKNVTQFLYLMFNHDSHTNLVFLKSFNNIIGSTTNSRLMEVLNQGLQINLVQLLKRSVAQLAKINGLVRKYSDQLFHTIKLIQTLLDRVYQIDIKLFNQVLNRMEMNGFDEVLEGMGHERYEQKIQEIYSNILDNYYSENQSQECSSYQNNQNDSHNMNAELDSGSHNKNNPSYNNHTLNDQSYQHQNQHQHQQQSPYDNNNEQYLI